MSTKPYENLDSSSEEEEYVAPETVIDMLKKIITRIQQREFNEIIVQDIHDCIEEFVKLCKHGREYNDHEECTCNPKDPFDKEIMAYFFRGWWLSQALINNPKENNNNTNICPFCLGSGIAKAPI